MLTFDLHVHPLHFLLTGGALKIICIIRLLILKNQGVAGSNVRAH